METPLVHIRDLGLIDYKEAWDLQESLLKESVDLKVANRTNNFQHRIRNGVLNGGGWKVRTAQRGSALRGCVIRLGSSRRIRALHCTH